MRQRQHPPFERRAHADELGYDRQGIQQKQVDDAERTPKPAEALQDQAGVADAADRTQPQYHLVHVENRHQQSSVHNKAIP